jgi:predicted transcriptional regulator
VFAAIIFALVDLPGQPPSYAKPQSGTNVRYIEVLENNTHLIYPALALFALVAIIVGILQAYRADDLSLVDKAEIKREIIQELRKHLSGLTVESLARSVALPRRKVDQVLEEMRTENIVDASTDGQRNTTWRMKL